MNLADQPMTIVVDGQTLSIAQASVEPLIRAVIVSLFSWRRALPDDPLPGDQRMGWWGDSFASIANDRIGSRLWLLTRAKLLPDTVARAREYALEALQWLIDDGVAARVEVDTERQGIDRLAIACRIYRTADGAPLDLRFANAWEYLNNV
jgi:phage gp46-like protein